MTASANKGYYEVPNISIEKALEILMHALNISSSLNVRVSVSIVDRSMNLVAFAKANDATVHSTQTSRKKANTAASTGKPTGWMLGDLAITLPLAAGNMLTNIPGGIPIILEGKLVGGLGVAGGSVEQDREIAMKAMQAIEANMP